jgi:hypothetical protein
MDKSLSTLDKLKALVRYEDLCTKRVGELKNQQAQLSREFEKVEVYSFPLHSTKTS